jgi:thiol-disulfide isomerase/thioredoxin
MNRSSALRASLSAQCLTLLNGLVIAAGVLVGVAAPSATAQTCPTLPGESCPGPRGASAADPNTLIGSSPPATSGKNLTGKGNLTLASLLGKPTAVLFWLNTCPHCRDALRQINRPRLEPGQQIVTAAINAGEKGPKGFETPAAAAKTLHLKVPTVLVANKVAKKQWRIATTPTVFIIDSGGVITQVLQPDDSNSVANETQAALEQTP